MNVENKAHGGNDTDSQICRAVQEDYQSIYEVTDMCSEKTSAFIANDNARIDALIESNPYNLGINDIAQFLNMDAGSVRSAIENNVFGISWKKNGCARHGYFIPTPQFIRWYLNM